MKLAITMAPEASAQAPIVLRGSFADQFRLAAQIGYDAVELHFPDPAELDLRDIRVACAANKVSVSSIGTGPAYLRDGLSLTSRDPGVRRRALARLQEFIRWAGELNSVVIIGLLKGEARDSESRDAYDDALTNSLAACMPLARECGVTVVLEAINRYESDVLNTIAECTRFIDLLGAEQLKLHIDTFHMNIEEDRISANIVRAGRHIGHVHIADSNRRYPGCGHYNFAETIAALRTAEYRGVLSVECLGLPTPDEAAREAYRFLSQATT
jgi:sugar phosphate isomerase/epimerase